MVHLIGVVILDLDQAAVTKRCLRSLVAGTRRPDGVVVVENGNQLVDPASDPMLSGLPVVVLRPDGNIGAAAGRNLGLNYLVQNTDVDLLVLLDNDTTVPADFFERLAARSLDSLEIVAPLILDMNSGNVFSAGGVIDEDGQAKHLADWPESRTEPRTIDWAATAALVFGRDTWLRVGGFDAWYKFLFEDVEWCQRAIQKGARIRLVPELRVEHDPHQSSGPFSRERVRHYSRNGTVFMFTARRGDSRALLKWFAIELRRVVAELRAGWTECAIGRLQGLAQGLLEVTRRRWRGATISAGH